MQLLFGMWHSFLHLLGYSWDYLVSLFDFNVPSLILFSIVIPFLIFIVTLFYRYRREVVSLGTPGKTIMKRIIKESFFSPQTIIAGAVSILAWVMLLSWGITYTTYKDHEALKGRITTLAGEKNKYKQEVDELKKQPQAKLKFQQQNKQETAVLPAIPSTPTPNLASIRIASQKQIPSTDPRLPYGLEVILQTDTTIQPVAFTIEFSGAIGKADASPVGINIGGLVSIQIFGKYTSVSNKQFLFGWDLPKFTSDNPIKVIVFSETSIRAIRFQKGD